MWWFRELEEHDYEKLESYWFRFQELATSEETNPVKRKTVDSIVNAIETLYNESEGLMREFIEQGYFDSAVKKIDPQYMSKQLGITKSKLDHMRKVLMKDTAKLIEWV